MTDTATFNVEFTWFDPYIGDPDTDPDSWFDPVEDAEEFQKHSMVYMATQHIANGEPIMHKAQDGSGNESSWTIVRVLGEKGETALQSLVFARCENQPQTPVGGDIENPLPNPNPAEDGTVWHDGIPAGNAMHPVWMSSRTFSTLKGVGSETWSDPMIMKDVPNLFDVEYSLVHENPGTPEDNENNWHDPTELTPELQAQVWWIAQRWCGIEWSTDGIAPGWSPWEVLKVRGEDGSKAVPRMRGDWETDVPAGDWLLCGFTHTIVKDGVEVKVIEEYQDIVYRKIGEKNECFKCLISHQKSDLHDPAMQQYVWDEKTQSNKSEDGYWLRAESYEFLSTRLLNAEQIISDIIVQNTNITPGKWTKSVSDTGSPKTIYTQVVTENGRIEFKYRATEEEAWKKSIEIGYDFNSESGILIFYHTDGITPLYNLGPKGLAAHVLNSPTINDSNVYFDGYRMYSDVYTCYGVFFESSERSNLYNEGIRVLSLGTKDCAGYIRLLTGYNSVYSNTDPKFRYKLLEHGSSTVHMSLGFTVLDPITGEIIPYETSDSVPPASYPPGGAEVINFGSNTIGFVGIRYPDLKYQEIKFSFENNNVDTSYGILTSPVRHWQCIYIPMTDLYEISLGSNYTESIEAGKFFNVGMSGMPGVIRGRWIGEWSESGGTSTGSWYSRYDIMPDAYSTKLLGAAINNKSNDLGEFSDRFIFESGGASPLMSEDDCVSVLTSALKIVKRFIYTLINETERGICTQNQNVITLWVESGIQLAFQGATVSSTNSSHFVGAHFIAKSLIEAIFLNRLASESNSSGITLGYVFPHNQYFKYDNRTLTLTGCDPIVEKSLFGGGQRYKGSGSESIWGSFHGINGATEGINNRAYLMIDSVSGTIGDRDSSKSVSPIGNTYKITAYSEAFVNDQEEKDIRITLKYEPVDYITAFLDKGECGLPIYRSPQFSSQNILLDYFIK